AAPPPGDRPRHGRRARLWNSRPAFLLRSAGADPRARGARLPFQRDARDQRAERRHRCARQLSRLRHPRRDGGGVHRRRRRDRPPEAKETAEREGQVKDDIILRVAAKIVMPFMLLFGLYVQFHGDFGPGGGFQAGVIAAAAIVFYGLIFGLDAARRLVPDRLVEALVALGVLIYAGVGIAGLLLGGAYLDYFVLDAHDT